MASTTTFFLVSFLFVFGLYRLLKLLGKKPVDAISLDAFLMREKKVRKFWLISFCMFSAFSYIGLTEMLLEKNGSFIEAFGFWQALAINLFFASIPFSIGCWITYHCAYFKKGTAWLKWLLITIPGKVLLNVMQELANSADSSPSSNAFLLAGLSIALFYWIWCLRLHNINSARKTLISPAPA